MKTPIVCLSAMLVVAACAAAETDLPHVSVFGTAVTEIEPDLLRWRLSVDTRGLDAAAVAEAHAGEVAAVLGFLRQHGMPPAETQTSRMRLAEHREYKRSSWTKEGYSASTEVAFTVKDLSGYGELWLGLSRFGGVTIHSAAWDSSRRIEVQNKTRLVALEVAREKAAAMAAALGVRLAEPLAIEEIPVFHDDARRNRVANLRQAEPAGDTAGSDSVSPGAIDVRVRVKVSFRIVSG